MSFIRKDHLIMIQNTDAFRDGETAQRLRALAVLSKDWSSVPSTHIYGDSKSSLTTVPEDPTCFWRHPQRHTIKNNYLKKPRHTNRTKW